jgi:hypothetical protein
LLNEQHFYFPHPKVTTTPKSINASVAEYVRQAPGAHNSVFLEPSVAVKIEMIWAIPSALKVIKRSASPVVAKPALKPLFFRIFSVNFWFYIAKSS